MMDEERYYWARRIPRIDTEEGVILTVEQADILRDALAAHIPHEPVGRVVKVYPDGLMKVELTDHADKLLRKILSEPKAWMWPETPR